MNKVLIIAYNKLDVISGTENYSRTLVEILNNNYQDIEIHIAIVDAKIKHNENENNVWKVKYHFIEKDFKKSHFKLLNYNRERKNINKFVKNIVESNNFNIIINATYIYFKNTSELPNSFLIQHNDVSLYLNTFIDENNKLISILSNWYLRFCLGSRRLIKKTTNIIVYDSFSKEILKKHSNMHFYIIPLFNKNTIDASSNNSFLKRKNIIYLGRIYENQKNISRLIKLNEKLSLIDFYGNLYDKDSAKYLDYLVKMNWYKGIVSSEKIEKVIDNYKFMILYSKYEGFSFSLVESLSCGVPIIVKDTFTAAKFLCNEKTGLLLQKDSSIDEDIKKIVDFYNMDDEKYLEYCKNCLDFYNKWLSYEQFEKKWESIFSEFLISNDK